jgi:hypothetical protein
VKRLHKGVTELDLLRDLMLGGRHSRQTAVRLGISFPTADRWLESLLMVPGVRKTKIGKTTWYEWKPPEWCRKEILREAERSGRLRGVR